MVCIAFTLRPAEKIVATWTAISPCTRENGCLAVIPGSHRGPLRRHGDPDWESVNYGFFAAEDIDLAVRTSFGARFPVIGPLEATDLGGLDVIAAIHEYLLEDLDRSTSPQQALLERVERGELGVKAGKGFHDWSQRDPAALVARRDAELAQRLRQLAKEGLISLPLASGAVQA